MRLKYFYKRQRKRGLSPVVATVLLISMVVAIAVIVFLWFRGMVEEPITKFEGKNIELVCDDVDFDAGYSNGFLDISNIASKNIPIYDINIRILSKGSENTKKLSEISEDWPKKGLNPGEVYSGNIENSVGNPDSITLIPVLLGNSEDGTKTHVCEESDGVEINNV